MKSYFTKKEQIVILIVVGVIVSIVGFKFISSKFIANNNPENAIVINKDKEDEEKMSEDDKNPQENAKQEDPDEADMGQEIEADIMVHISGQVKNPGIVQVKSGKRLIDAVELLGGLTEDADGDRINLAKKLQDEEKIYIPKIGEEVELALALIETPSTTSETPRGAGQDVSGKIDINTCTKEMLNTLPGIGEVLSNRIMEYRETTIFKTIEDIMNVSGIGAKKFEGIKELIIVK